MAYQTGGAASIGALIDAVKIFAVAQGWVLDQTVTLTPDVDELNTLHNPNGDYFNLRWDTVNHYINSSDNPAVLSGNSALSNPLPILEMNVGNNYTPGRHQTSNHAGMNQWRVIVQCNGFVFPIVGYHLFGTADYIHCIVESITGRFTSFFFGSIEPYGVVPQGGYVTATSWDHYGSASSRYNNSPYSPRNQMPFCSEQNSGISNGTTFRGGRGASWLMMVNGDYYWGGGGIASGVPTSNELVYDYRYKGDTGAYRPEYREEFMMLKASPNTFNGVSPLIPVIPRVAVQSGLYREAGEVRDLRIVDVTNYTPKEIQLYGSDEWMIFPIKQKTSDFYASNGPNGDDTRFSSANFGLALRKF